jgi:hypothetical protein
MFGHGCLNEIDVNILIYSDSWTLFGTVGLLSDAPNIIHSVCSPGKKMMIKYIDLHKTKETPREENALSVSVYMP